MRRVALSGLLLIVIIGMVLSAYVPVIGVKVDVASKGRPPWKPPPPGKEKEGGAATGVVSPPPRPKHRWALIIGIADYPGTGDDLKYADDDARDLNKTLVERYGYQVNHIKVLIDDEATKSGILTAIAWLRDSEGPGDEVVFYYSGHGDRGVKQDADEEITDEGIVPYDVGVTGLIWDGDLATEFSTYNTTRFFIGFDACYAGGFDDLAGNGRVICMSSSQNKVSYEGDAWQNGEFTYYFVEQGMYNRLADANGDTHVTVEEAFDYAKANCRYDDPVINDQLTNDMLL